MWWQTVHWLVNYLHSHLHSHLYRIGLRMQTDEASIAAFVAADFVALVKQS